MFYNLISDNHTELGRNTSSHRVLYSHLKNSQVEFGTEVIYKNKIIPEHTHPSQSEIIFVHKGQIQVTLNGVTRVLNEGESVFIACGLRHSFQCLDEQDCWITWTLLEEGNGDGGESRSLVEQINPKK